MRAERYWRYGSLGLSALLYFLCLPFDAFCVRNVSMCSALPAYYVLTFGPFGLAVSPTTSWIWLANPVLFGAWLALVVAGTIRTLASNITALILGLAALAIAASFLLQRQIMTDARAMVFPITGYGTGYWLWLSSMAVCCLGGMATLELSMRHNKA